MDAFPDNQNVKEELLESIVEVNIGICDDVEDIRRDLKSRINEVQQVAEKENMAFIEELEYGVTVEC